MPVTKRPFRANKLTNNLCKPLRNARCVCKVQRVTRGCCRFDVPGTSTHQAIEEDGLDRHPSCEQRTTMNRRFLLKSGGFTAVGLALSLPAFAKEDGKPGKLDADAFTKANEQAGAKLKAMKPDASSLSDGDKTLVGEIALGGMMQLQASELALEKSKSADVKMIAKAETEEQKGLASKLEEFAKKKGVTLPTGLNDKGRKLLADLKAARDRFDRAYLEGSGVKGHEELKKTMSTVRDKAADPMLKALAEIALPLIEIHLTVSQDEVGTLA